MFSAFPQTINPFGGIGAFTCFAMVVDGVARKLAVRQRLENNMYEIRKELCTPAQIKQVSGWRVDGKFYHSLKTATDAAFEYLALRVRVKAMYRRRDAGNAIVRDQANLESNYYEPGGFYDQWCDRNHQRVATMMQRNFNKRV